MVEADKNMRASNPSEPTAFLTTCWTDVHQAAQGGNPDATKALGTLFTTYWPPLYRYVRRLGRTPADAEDLVQGFFTHLLSKEGLRFVDRTQGRFRAFLLAAFKHYLAKDWQHAHRQKRGGFAHHLSLDLQSAEADFCTEPVDTLSPDLLYDQDWATTLLAKVLADMDQEEPGGEFDRWKPFLSVSSAQLPYADVAARFGLEEGTVRVAVHRLRKRYRQRLRAEIARTLAAEDPTLVEEEMRALFAALAR